MVSVHYFASIRESVGLASEELTLPGSVTDVQGLIDYLVARNPEKLEILALDSRVLVAVNQTVVDRSQGLRGDEEVAFFPPMTGG